ncbi:MAG: hypothetical protein V1894_02740 [Chloroflexota bacterium]
MIRRRWLSKWLVLPLIAVLMLSGLTAGLTVTYFNDQESSAGNTGTAWTSAQWTQTSQADFNAGVLNNVDTATAPGDVTLPVPVVAPYSPTDNTGTWTNGPQGNYAYSSNNKYATYTPSTTTSTGSPAANSGSGWTNPTNAYASDTNYATQTSGGTTNTYGTYGFSLTGDPITQVRVRADAFSTGDSISTSKNPTANTNGTIPWTNPVNGYTSNNSYATVSPTYNSTTSKNPTANTNGTVPWTNPANGYTSNNSYATVSPTYNSTTSKNPTANTNGANPWTNPANGYTSDNSYATAPAPTGGPTFRAAGTAATAASGNVTPGLPTGWQANDICLLLVASRDNVSHSVSGYTQIGSQTNNGTGLTTSLWYRRLVGGDGSPTVTHTAGSQISAVTIAYYGCTTSGSPLDGNQAWYADTTSDTTANFGAGFNTTKDNDTVILLSATNNRATSATYTGSPTPTERYDNPYTNNYPSLDIADFTLASPGATGSRAATLSTARLNNGIQIALFPSKYDVMYDHIYGTFAITDPGSSSTITKVEVGYEAFATATQQLDIYTSANGGSSWSSVHTSANLPTADPNAYTYIDVSADQTWTWTLLNDTNFKYKIVTRWVNGTPTWSVDALVVRVTYDDRRPYDQIYGTFGITDPGTSTTITKVEIGYEAFATATGQLNIYDSTNGGAGWSSAHNTGNLTTSDPNTYTYIDVTSDFSWTWTLLNDTNFKVRVVTNYVSGSPAWSLDALVARVTYDDRRAYDHIYGTFGITDPGGTPPITKVELGYEAFATATGQLNIYDSTNGGAGWSSAHNTGNLATSDPNAYTYIDVTSDFSWTWTLLNDTNFKVRVVTNYASGTPAWSLDALVARVTYATSSTDDQIRVAVSWNGGSSWSADQTATLTGTKATYWFNVTGATTWDATKLNDSNLRVRVDSVTVGDTSTISLDWLPVEVTHYDTTTWSHTYLTYGISLTGYLITKVEAGVEAYAASSEKVELDVTWNNGSNWSSRQTSSALGSADPDSTTWFDFTSATSWTPTTLNDANFKVRIWYLNNGAYGQVSLDYIPVRVTYRVPSGTIASAVWDTTVTGSGWDGLAWDKTLPAGTSITFEVRASDSSFLKTDGSPSWTSAGGTSPVISGLPSGRYKQWLATLNTSDASTPTLSEARLFYDGG